MQSGIALQNAADRSFLVDKVLIFNYYFFSPLVNFVHAPKSCFSLQDKLLSPALNKVTSTPSFTAAVAETAGDEE